MTKMYTIGKVTSSHGLKGLVKMYPYFDSQVVMTDLNRVYIQDEEYALEKVRNQGLMYLLKLTGIDSKEEAENLRDEEVRILEEDRMPLPEGTFNVDDILGMRVFEETGRDLGHIKEVLKTGANDIYVVACPLTDEGLPKEFLFPALRHLVVEISVVEKKMVVKIPEGLI